MAPPQYLLEIRPAKPVMKMRVGGGQILWKDLAIRLQEERCIARVVMIDKMEKSPYVQLEIIVFR